MAEKVIAQEHGEGFSLYNGDSCDVLRGLPDESVHLSLYSPPFCGLYTYSSSERDLSNCRGYEEFFQHYAFIVKEIFRLTPAGRLSGVHCMDVPEDSWSHGLRDFPGDIIRLHKELGFYFVGRYAVWKEPLAVRNRTMKKGLAHKQIVDDSSLCDVASADYLLMFRKRGENKVKITHPVGLSRYAGESKIPSELLRYKGWTGKQTQNLLSHWIWRRYASAFWNDVRVGRVLPYKETKEPDDERHVHPLQLDVIERCLTLWSNPGEVVLTPFMGVGSEAYGAYINGRKAIGIELKPSYYKQAVKVMRAAADGWRDSGATNEEDALFVEQTKNEL